MNAEVKWPGRLVLRDTKVFADEGQRIYTTATGYGYEKLAYVRVDIFDDVLNALKAFVKANQGVEDYSLLEDEATARRLAVAAISKAEASL